MLNKVGGDMPLNMVHADKRQPFCKGKCLCKGNADQERTDQSRSARDGNGIHLRQLCIRLRQRFTNHAVYLFDMFSGGDFRNHASVLCVNFNLGGDDIASHIDPVYRHGCRRFITRTLNAKDGNLPFTLFHFALNPISD